MSGGAQYDNISYKDLTVPVMRSQTYCIDHSRSVTERPWRRSPMDLPTSTMYTVASFSDMMGGLGCDSKKRPGKGREK